MAYDFPDIGYIEGSFCGPFSPEQVTKVERMAGVVVPKSFVQYCQSRNGGVPISASLKIGEDTTVIERFLCFISDYKSDPSDGLFDVGVVWSQIEDRLDEHLLPFAALFAGDYLCFDTGSETGEAVVFWDHERSQLDEPVTTPIAGTFTEFLGMLGQTA